MAQRQPLQPLVDRIQRECLRAYPEELLAEMASGAREIPEDVEADPTAQMRFLDKEVAREKGLFYPILLEDLLPAFQRYVTPGARFLDLGSGDGRAVFLARVLGAHATVLLVGHEQAPFPGLALETAFPDPAAPHSDVKVYRSPMAAAELATE